MINIQSTPAKIGMTLRPAQQTISQPKADLTIEQPQAILSLSTTPSFLSIDQSKAWSDMDLKGILQRSREWAEQGYQDLLDGIAREAEQGDELMKIENKGHPIVSQAVENSKSQEWEFGYGTLPSTPFRVELDYKPAKLNIDWERKDPIIKSTPRPPQLSYERGGVDIYLRQQASVSISFEPKIDLKG